ncbi:MAG: hypothetical protein KKD32_03820 [Proteobacteria bacterium]|nr:hypothetical protein [Pseudomonadota bacterium]MBU1586289.1 hypothetical protein [Pseudomonadota bacterium]MBU2453185.1 hypothetical protein [Pseudomonadota bacterium]MBU2630784.1 hypothetical protein [Pseudomonadota bacterium]
MFKVKDNTKLDIIVDRSDFEKKCIIVWPWIGGNTRVFMMPVKKFTDMGYSVVQYNPRTHGKSGGQISMKAAIEDLYYFLHKYKLLSVPLIGVGHSFGTSALLQLNYEILNIEKLFLIEPSLDFRASIRYMYKIGSQNEFITSISKFSNDPDLLSELLHDEQWFDLDYWYQNDLKSSLNTLSNHVKIGDFLEDFYIPGHNTISNYIFHKDIIHTYISTHDTWYPIEQLYAISRQNNISHSTIQKAKDHYFYFAWGQVWDSILNQLN